MVWCLLLCCLSVDLSFGCWVVVNSVVHFNFLLLIYSVIEIWLFGCNDGVLAVGLLWIAWVAA